MVVRKTMLRRLFGPVLVMVLFLTVFLVFFLTNPQNGIFYAVVILGACCAQIAKLGDEIQDLRSEIENLKQK